ISTDLAPDDPAGWRSRAMLLFQVEPYGASLRPRDESWLPVLEEARGHDPSNALYDYLASGALHDLGDWQTNVTVAEIWALSRVYFDRARGLPEIDAAQEVWPSIAEFLAHSRVPPHEYEELILSHAPGPYQSAALNVRITFPLYWRFAPINEDERMR